jgi:polyhydroxyalkanoate synthesis repressor PhaR
VAKKAQGGEAAPTVIKKYANRRLYHTGTSTYVTLEDLAAMVQAGEDFAVFDAKSGEDITRSVLTQIIFEQENKAGSENLLPVAFLRQLIRFYNDSMRAFVPSYLEFSMENLAKDGGALREKMTEAFGKSPFNASGFGGGAFGGPAFRQAMEEQVRANMAFFGEAMKMFQPSYKPPGPPGPPAPRPPEPQAGGSDLDELKRQMAEMQARLETLVRK